jgi:type II secretory ATPase GspE/PulE/Tfp pilus assembly ATPase PilB-like protein
VLPLYRVHGELTIAITDPTDVFTRDALRRLTNLKLRFVVAHPATSPAASRPTTSPRSSCTSPTSTRTTATTTSEVVAEAIDDIGDIEKQAGLSKVVQLVNYIVARAIRDRASDIHIEPGEDLLRVRYRVDGMLREVLRPNSKASAAIVSRIKIMSSMDIAERRMPQDGRMQVMLDNRSIDLRVSTLPTFCGEKVVIRILDRSAMMGDLSALGLTPRILEGMQDLVNRPNGVCSSPARPARARRPPLRLPGQHQLIDMNICTVENPTEHKPMVNRCRSTSAPADLRHRAAPCCAMTPTSS